MSNEIKEEAKTVDQSVVSSIFYAEYPTPEECRQFMEEVEQKSKKVQRPKSLKEKTPRKRALKQTAESLERSRENQRRKERMCLPKNTFILRFPDLDNGDLDVIWCVDNHQLLSKYVLVIDEKGTAEKRRVYTKTERYTGWLCDEFWTVFALDGRVELIDGDKRISVELPTAEEVENTRIELLKRRQLEGSVEPEIEMPVEDEQAEKSSDSMDDELQPEEISD